MAFDTVDVVMKGFQMISVIIPVYNKAPFLRRCLDSLVNQTDKSAQVIIVDDGSTDGSRQICDEYKKHGFEVYHKKKNAGVAAARNFGLKKVKGDYVAFLDADDAYTLDAVDVMTRITRHDFNIYQFGQYRCHPHNHVKDHFNKGFYLPESLPRRWAMVWNKLYKKSFIDEHKIKFIEPLQFGEDEIFSAQAILADGGLYHAPQHLMLHYFDDKKSLCRGELSLERLTGLVDKLEELGRKEVDPAKAKWYFDKANAHKSSALFKRFGYKEPTGRYDIVYFLKNTQTNEELRYSLRSVEANWQYNKVWFYGGCPIGLTPDHHVRVDQLEPSKWERVRNMLRQACLNDNLTEDFWLFNDDFFIMRPIPEQMRPQYNGTLEAQIERVEARHGNSSTDYTRRLKHLLKTLQTAGKGTLNYSVHKPMLINRKKMLEVMDKVPNEPMSRALYGNYWEVGGVSKTDMKVMLPNYSIDKISSWEFLSTSDESFKVGNVGKYIRQKFPNRSRFENGTDDGTN